MLSTMRTTVTLDADTEQLLRRRMADRKVTFKQALNDAIRAGLGQGEPPAFRTKTFDMGEPTVDLTHLGRLLDDLAISDYLEKDARARADRAAGP